ncbi:hypothetical protein AB835_08235 [Candidatus Endobugula sertula]|uniref:Antitoxin n=1 Tax=Candidatus Endobugula sertula TaxID=62101 RepID=A0A1D2QPU0_9GAMM|nr:hypothetical protein AB835_08235 [Candidatus Endobugula sertula]
MRESMSVTATELKNRLGKYIDECQAEPVVIEKSGRECCVLLSMRRYEELCQIEEKLWDMRAQQAESEGFMSHEEVRDVLVSGPEKTE